MLYIIGAISIASLILNILIFNKLNRYEEVELIVEEIKVFDPDPEPEVEKVPEPSITTQMVKEVYQGWVNKTNIPFSDYGPPQKPIKPERPGPLERPGGFV